MNNYLSIDLESWAMPNIPEYLQLSSGQKKKLDGGNSRDSIIKTLNILMKSKTKLTFFVVGQIYEWYPKLVEKIADQGHEIAFHTHDHNLMNNNNELIRNIELSKKFIQKFKPKGFRAPRISIKKEHLSILKSFGFKYDSSVYGPYASRSKISGLLELPVTSACKVPFGSGYFIGLLGKNIEGVYRKINKSGFPVISFLHNWQILKPLNPSFPTAKYLLKNPHYFPYLIDCCATFEFLLKKFTFKPMKNLL